MGVGERADITFNEYFVAFGVRSSGMSWSISP
jgi:hypothetical protein